MIAFVLSTAPDDDFGDPDAVDTSDAAQPDFFNTNHSDLSKDMGTEIFLAALYTYALVYWYYINLQRACLLLKPYILMQFLYDQSVCL